MNKYPEWATEKQQEGMEKFRGIASEYHDFTIDFTQSDLGEEDSTRFYANVSWGSEGLRGQRKHKFDIAYDYEATWDRCGVRLHEWQFLFAGGDATREISTEVFFLDLFFYLDGLPLNQ